MATNAEKVIEQAISDFDDIEAAIEESGIDVPYDTDTSEYGNLIRSIPKGGAVDQTYNPESQNAQSGIAVAEALYFMESTENKVTEITDKATDKQYPSAKAVFDKFKEFESNKEDISETANALKATASGEVIRVDDVSLIEHTVKAKVSGKNKAHFSESIALTPLMTPISIACDVKAPFVLSYNLTVESVQETSSAFVNVLYTDGTNTYDAFAFRDGTHTEQIQINNGKQVKEICILNWNQAIGTLNWLQVEEGDTATEYEPYIDLSTVTVTRCGKNIIGLSEREVVDFGNFGSETTRTFTGKGIILGVTANNYYSRTDITEYNITDESISFTTTGGGYGIGIDVPVKPKTTYTINSVYSTNANNIAVSEYTNEGEFITFTVLSNGTFTTGENTGWIVLCFRSATTGENTIYYKIQLEVGGDVTEYESYNGETYTPSTDGTVEIPSLSPTMTILTDTEGVNIEIEYNQDTNKALGYVNEDIKTLDNDMAELKGNMGDVETALDNIIAIQNGMIGGESV